MLRKFGGGTGKRPRAWSTSTPPPPVLSEVPKRGSGDISMPSNFRHVSHLSCNDLQSMPSMLAKPVRKRRPRSVSQPPPPRKRSSSDEDAAKAVAVEAPARISSPLVEDHDFYIQAQELATRLSLSPATPILETAIAAAASEGDSKRSSLNGSEAATPTPSRRASVSPRRRKGRSRAHTIASPFHVPELPRDTALFAGSISSLAFDELYKAVISESRPDAALAEVEKPAPTPVAAPEPAPAAQQPVKRKTTMPVPPSVASSRDGDDLDSSISSRTSITPSVIETDYDIASMSHYGDDEDVSLCVSISTCDGQSRRGTSTSYGSLDGFSRRTSGSPTNGATAAAAAAVAKYERIAEEESSSLSDVSSASSLSIPGTTGSSFYSAHSTIEQQQQQFAQLPSYQQHQHAQPPPLAPQTFRERSGTLPSRAFHSNRKPQPQPQLRQQAAAAAPQAREEKPPRRQRQRQQQQPPQPLTCLARGDTSPTNSFHSTCSSTSSNSSSSMRQQEGFRQRSGTLPASSLQGAASVRSTNVDEAHRRNSPAPRQASRSRSVSPAHSLAGGQKTPPPYAAALSFLSARGPQDESSRSPSPVPSWYGALPLHMERQRSSSVGRRPRSASSGPRLVPSHPSAFAPPPRRISVPDPPASVVRPRATRTRVRSVSCAPRMDARSPVPTYPIRHPAANPFCGIRRAATLARKRTTAM